MTAVPTTERKQTHRTKRRTSKCLAVQRKRTSRPDREAQVIVPQWPELRNRPVGALTLPATLDAPIAWQSRQRPQQKAAARVAVATQKKSQLQTSVIMPSSALTTAPRSCPTPSMYRRTSAWPCAAAPASAGRQKLGPGRRQVRRQEI